MKREADSSLVEEPLSKKRDLILSTEEPSSLQPEQEVEADDIVDSSDMSLFRLKLSNINRFFREKEFKKWLAKTELLAQQSWFDATYTTLKVKKAPKWSYAVLTFKSEESMNAALQFFATGSVTCKNQTVQASEFNEPEKTYQRREYNSDSQFSTSAVNRVDSRSSFEKIADQTISLWRLSYKEQIEQKQTQTLKALTKFQLQMQYALKKNGLSKEIVAQQYPWVIKQQKPPCPVDEIISSPIINGYRTKCEFAIGYESCQSNDMEGETIVPDSAQLTVGFMQGAFKNGRHEVISPKGLLHINETTIKIADIIQQFVRESTLIPYNRETKEGNFRLALVRTPSSGETMTILQIHPQKLSLSELDEQKNKFKDMFTIAMTKVGLPVTVLGWQIFTGITDQFSHSDSVELLVGERTIVNDTLLGYQFEISPTSFFQVNTPAAEKLYGVVRGWATNGIPVSTVEDNGMKQEDSTIIQSEKELTLLPSGKKRVLLDLCCGTGTIGICLSKHFDKIIGVEIVPEAVQDAQENARRNGVLNATYIAGKVEDMLGGLLTKKDLINDSTSVLDSIPIPENSDQDKEENTVKMSNTQMSELECVTVLDPPRNGVHASVIRAIRSSPAIQRVIYVSCDIRQATQNFVDLCRPTSKRYILAPFKPVRAVAVDLFPHTVHVETVIEFVREQLAHHD